MPPKGLRNRGGSVQNLGLLKEEKAAQHRAEPDWTLGHVRCPQSGLGWRPFPHGSVST